MAESARPVLRFHHNHGYKVELHNNAQTVRRAEFAAGFGGGEVMSRAPMLINHLYHVHIDEVWPWWPFTCLGVVTKDPRSFILPFEKDNPEVLYIGARTSIFGEQDPSSEWKLLMKLPVGSCVGLLLDSDRGLNLYINGEHLSFIAPDMPDPCYFMFDVDRHCKQMTALPVREAT